MPTIKEYLQALKVSNEGELPLSDEQLDIIRHDYQNPLWIIAGPGTGKTHTLVYLVLKRIIVDGIDPTQIFLTTFTKKASVELISRITKNRKKLIEGRLEEASDLDTTQIKVGTLHSLCSQILQDQRYEPTLRIRVLEDEMTQEFFLRRHRNPLFENYDLGFWKRFGFIGENDRFPPNRAKMTSSACKLFNRITENSVNVTDMHESGDVYFKQIAEGYWDYQQKLQDDFRTDQAHLQKHFLDFLQSEVGQQWIGSGLHVFVDEYQDTNPIQEQIYFTLVGSQGSLTVVGDDDQSLYRFRGARVECLVNFDKACEIFLHQNPIIKPITENRRSHKIIVEWVNRFISTHPEMIDPDIRVRAPEKPELRPVAENMGGDYPAIMSICESTNPRSAVRVLETIQDLVNDDFVQDYSQIALLSFSTRESTHGISAYTDALRDANIPIYNPRNKRVQRDPNFQALLGALICILDPKSEIDLLPASLSRGLQEYIGNCRDVFQNLIDSGQYNELRDYVFRSMEVIQGFEEIDAAGPTYLTRQGGRRVVLSGLFYKLLANEPFATVMNELETGERFKALNIVLSSFESLYDNGEIRLETHPNGGSKVDGWALYGFYAVCVGGVMNGLNDPENEEISIQPGMVNVMTIHQAKGLEFEVVFVLRPEKQTFVSDTHILEDELHPFVQSPTKPARLRSQELRNAEDTIRLFLVAYSRAKRLLILAGTKIQDWDRVLGKDLDGNSLNSRQALLSKGVYRL